MILGVLGNETYYQRVYEECRRRYGIHRIVAKDLVTKDFTPKTYVAPKKAMYDDYSFRSSFSRSIRNLFTKGLVDLEYHSFPGDNKKIHRMRLTHKGKCLAKGIGFAEYVNFKERPMKPVLSGGKSRQRYIQANICGVNHDMARKIENISKAGKLGELSPAYENVIRLVKKFHYR